jgi:hypothetical protein
MAERANHPNFIIGVHRSGTTLLRYMLSSSPHICIQPESDFIPRFFLRNPTGSVSEKRVAGPLLEELGYELASSGVMSQEEEARYRALHLKYETLQHGRKLAQKLGLVPPI